MFDNPANVICLNTNNDNLVDTNNGSSPDSAFRNLRASCLREA